MDHAQRFSITPAELVKRRYKFVLREHISHTLYRYEQYLRLRVRSATRIRSGRTVWRFLRLFGYSRLSSYHHAELSAYKSKRQGQGASRETIQREVAVIKDFFRWAGENLGRNRVDPSWRRVAIYWERKRKRRRAIPRYTPPVGLKPDAANESTHSF